MASQTLSKTEQFLNHIRHILRRIRARITRRTDTPITISTSLSLTSISQQTVYSIDKDTYTNQNSSITQTKEATRSSGPQTEST